MTGGWGERTEDGRVWWGRRPDQLATLAVDDAARCGLVLDLQPDTPVVPDELFPHLADRTVWAEVDSLVRRLGDVGCSWVNLRFAIEPDGAALVRYEARPSGWPLDGGGIPACNGGFDAHRALPPEELDRLYRPDGNGGASR